MADQRSTLRAVHDDDLEKVLDSLGVLGAFNQSRMRCAFCGDTITFDNLHSLFGDSGTVKASCSKPDCVKKLLARLDDRRMSRHG
jgi:hypothetical protein